MVSARYHRQTLVPGWDQARLGTAQILIVGSDTLAAVIAVGAAALGVKGVTLLDDATIDGTKGSLLAGAPAGTRRARVLEAAVRRLNPEVIVQSVVARLVVDIQLRTLPALSAIIVANGGVEEVAICTDFAAQRLIPLIVAQAGASQGFCAIGPQSTAEAMTALASDRGAPRLAISCVIGALALSELRARLTPLAPSDLKTERATDYAARRRKRCVGWWHAHPGHTFHSGTDDHNLQTALGDVAISLRWPLSGPRRTPVRWEDGALVIYAGTETIRLTGEALAALRSEDATDPALVAEAQSNALAASAAYSLVVSASGKAHPYAEMATQVLCATCGRRETQARQVSIEIVEPDAPDYEAMRVEVRRKVLNLPGRDDGVATIGEAWARWLTELGFSNRFIARRVSPLYGARALLPPVDVVISATNSAELQQALIGHAGEENIPIVIGASVAGAGWLHTIARPGEPRPPPPPQSTNDHPQSAASAAVIGAFMAEEARQLLAPLLGDIALPAGFTLNYHIGRPRRFTGEEAPLQEKAEHWPPRRALLVGAGGLGTFAALGLVAQGEIAALTIVDPDYIETTNLNRQPLYLRNVGDGKAITLARRLRRICPTMRIDYCAEPISPWLLHERRPDLALSCVDSFAPRQWLHSECLRLRLPLINGGTDALAGHLEVYSPGRSACFNCLYALDNLAEREARARSEPARCQRAIEASIATTNALIGGLMAAESLSLHEPLRLSLQYNARLATRFRAGYLRRSCVCV